MAAPLLTFSIWPLPQTETGNTVNEEMVPGTFTRRWVNHASIACPLASGWVAQCPGALVMIWDNEPLLVLNSLQF